MMIINLMSIILLILQQIYISKNNKQALDGINEANKVLVAFYILEFLLKTCGLGVTQYFSSDENMYKFFFFFNNIFHT